MCFAEGVHLKTKIARKNNSAGFTLMELLVVIGLVSIMALIVIASVATARERGRIAANQKFAASLNNVVGAYNVGSWEFEEGSGATSADSSGRNYTAILNNNTWSTGTLSVSSKNAVSFNGTNAYVQIPHRVTALDATGYTYSFWFKWDGGGGGTGARRALLESSSNYFMSAAIVAGTPSYLQMYTQLSSGAVAINGTTDIEINKWYFAAFTWDRNAGANNMRIYINGRQDAQGTIASGDPAVYTSIIVGSYRSANDRWFSGLMDDVRIYEQALPRAEIEKMYAEGLKKRLAME